MTSDERLGSAVLVALILVAAVVGMVRWSPWTDDSSGVAIVVREVPDAGVEIDAADGRARPSWVRRVSARTDVPTPAVRAYADAALRASEEVPGCHLRWTTLAGIGRVESSHGTFGGRRLRVDGTSARPVVGPALNGRGMRAVTATEQGTRWHGDGRWEHAVGALQFLPETWARFAADGDGDGRRTPLDLDDAAAGAARYLCSGERDLGQPSGWNTAVFRYNASAPYLRDVARAADAVARRSR